MKKYIVFKTQGYDEYNEEKELFMRTIDIDVIANTESEALKKAQERHPEKPLFRCVGSIEKVI